MSTDLQDLFDRAGRNAPPLGWDADAVLLRARHVRSRRVRGAVAAAVALAVAVVLVGLASQRLPSADPVPVAPRPTRALPIPVVAGSLGKLAYVTNGDVYLADADGSHPVRIADGAPSTEAGGCLNYWAEGPMWSPDGRYLAYRGPLDADQSGRGCSPGGDVIISDPNGRRLASFPAEGWSVAWSPDSTRVAVWVSFGARIGIFGLDGVRQAQLTLPRECSLSGDYDPVWSPNGASLLITKGCEIPIDGSAGRQLPPDDPRSQLNARYSPDGTTVAFVSQDGLVVADADGSHARVLVAGAQPGWYLGPVWSPTGDRIVFVSRPNGGAGELRVVDVASGTVVSLADMRATGDSTGFIIRLSPDGDQVLFARPDGKAGSSLWSVHTDGSDLHRLAAEAAWGDWQQLITDIHRR